MQIDEEALFFYANEPIYFVEDLLHANPDQHQRDILRSIRDYPMTSVRSGHGIGKTAVESWVIIWFMITRPFPKIPCTAPTQHQLFDILWSEVSKWLRSNPDLTEDIIWTQEKIYLRGHPEEWFAVPRTATNPDALQGFHADHLLYILDEASGISDKTFEPVLGALTGPDAKLLMMGNPTRLAGFFYDSHNKSRAAYNAMHIDGRDSERVSQEFIQKIITMFGMDSDVFRVRVAGMFPGAIPDSLIALDWCTAATKLDLMPARLRLDIGVDVARYGDDSSVLYPLWDKVKSELPEIHNHNRTTEIAGYVVLMLERYAADNPECLDYHVKVDCDGLGVGVFDNLIDQVDKIVEQVWKDRCCRESIKPDSQESDEVPRINLKVVEGHFGAAGGKVNDTDPVRYSNSTGLMWGALRQTLQDGTLQLPDNDMLISQLSNRKYMVNKDGELELERKENMKKRGLKSPDIADALALAMYDPPEKDWELRW